MMLDIQQPAGNQFVVCFACLSINLHCENTVSTPADIAGMDRISRAIEERCGYICSWDCQKVTGLVIDGSVGLERYLS
jgi:hypothetical protein